MIEELEGNASLQMETLQALNQELAEAKMAQAQAASKLAVSTESYARLEGALAESRAELETLKAKLKMMRSNQGVGESMSALDLDIVSMKYQLWKPKMTCGSCTENGNDVEVFLPCGHMLCQNCVDQITKNRQRACPFDRRKFTTNDTRRIYWATNN